MSGPVKQPEIPNGPGGPRGPSSPPPPPVPKGSVAVQALLMALGTLTSRVLGLVREILFAALFSRMITDSWYAAFRLPNIFRRLLGEGSLSVSFIPVFVEAQLDSEERARNLLNAFYTLFLIIVSALTAAGILGAEKILPYLLNENFLAQPEKHELVLRMSQIMFAYVFLVCTYAYFMAILNAMGRFGWPALAPTFFNVAMVISTLIPPEYLSWPGQALSWGVIIGGILQAVVLLPSLKKLGYLPKFSFRFWNNPDVWRVLRAMGPGLIGMGLLQVTTLVNMQFASSLGDGPISYLNLADRLMELPLSLVSVSIGTALLPTLSRMWSEDRKEMMIETADEYFRLNLFICLPAAVGLFCLAHPIVELLFERGEFRAFETGIVADVIRVYALIMIFTSSVRVFVPAFYAIKNTWLPAGVSIVCLLLHIYLAPTLMADYGLRGLNLSSLVSVVLNWTLLFIAFRILIGKFPWSSLMWSLLKWSVPLAGLFLWLQSYWFFRYLVGDHFFGKLVVLGGEIAVGVLIFAVLSHFMAVSEFKEASEAMTRKLSRRYPRLFKPRAD